MSGPIVRKYGFPNFEKIFGEQKMKHGTEEKESNAPSEDSTTPADATDSSRDTAKSVSPKSTDQS